MKVRLQNETTGINRTVKVGFSWVILFFGFIPFLLRGMLVHATLIFLWDIGVPLIYCIINKSSFQEFGFTGLGTFVANLILAFIGNKMTASYYLERGYKRIGEGWDYANAKWGFINSLGAAKIQNGDLLISDIKKPNTIKSILLNIKFAYAIVLILLIGMGSFYYMSQVRRMTRTEYIAEYKILFGNTIVEVCNNIFGFHISYIPYSTIDAINGELNINNDVYIDIYLDRSRNTRINEFYEHIQYSGEIMDNHKRFTKRIFEYINKNKENGRHFIEICRSAELETQNNQ